MSIKYMLLPIGRNDNITKYKVFNVKEGYVVAEFDNKEEAIKYKDDKNNN